MDQNLISKKKKRSANGVSGQGAAKVFLNGTKMFVAGNFGQVGGSTYVGNIASWDGKLLEQNIIKPFLFWFNCP